MNCLFPITFRAQAHANDHSGSLTR
jgi:hypothetical protein